MLKSTETFKSNGLQSPISVWDYTESKGPVVCVLQYMDDRDHPHVLGIFATIPAMLRWIGVRYELKARWQGQVQYFHIPEPGNGSEDRPAFSCLEAEVMELHK